MGEERETVEISKNARKSTRWQLTKWNGIVPVLAISLQSNSYNRTERERDPLEDRGGSVHAYTHTFTHTVVPFIGIYMFCVFLILYLHGISKKR